MTRPPDTRAHGESPLTWLVHTTKPLTHKNKTLWNAQESARLGSEVTEKGLSDGNKFQSRIDPDQFSDPTLSNIIQNFDPSVDVERRNSSKTPEANLTRPPDTRAHGESPLTWWVHTAKPLTHENKTLWSLQESGRLESEVTEKGLSDGNKFQSRTDPDQFEDLPLSNIIQNLRNYLTKTSTPRNADDSIIRKGFNATHDALALLAGAVTELQSDLGKSTKTKWSSIK